MSDFLEIPEFEGVWTRSLALNHDDRGFFYEELRQSDLPSNCPNFVQDSISFSNQNVLRGMHLQKNQWQLVTLLEGEIFDVLLNIDRQSSNFKKSIQIHLSWNKLNQILIAPGIAHGFAVLSDHARIHYKSNVYYQSGDQVGVSWKSDEIVNYWPQNNWITSERDSNFATLESLIRSNSLD
jgi:dTDP-4-dehydrorhamnose 3,5-epimerase